MKSLFIFIILILSLSITKAQKEYYNWYFGYKVGMTFNTPNAEPLPLLDGGMNSFEGCSAISDSFGNLLFYSNGEIIWNKEHKIMKNGNNLFGGYSAAQSVIIVPKPNSNHLFYVFTNDAIEYHYKDGISYSIVDMNLENGLGAVIEKNIHLIYNGNERLTATYHKNNKDIWIATQDIRNKNFALFLLTEEGLNHNPVLSPFSSEIFDSTKYITGYMKFSPNNYKLAFANQGEDRAQLYDFNSETGIISSEIFLDIDGASPYGIEFSSNSQFLYVATRFHGIFQYEINFSDTYSIKKSRFQITNNKANYKFMAMQLAPNRKIYITGQANKKLSVINSPNKQGIGCDIKIDEVDLQKDVNSWGITFVLNSVKNNFICAGESIFLFGKHIEGSTLKWIGPLGFSSNEINPVITNAKPEMSGFYHFTINFNDSIVFYDSILVTVKPLEKILFADSTEIIVNTKTYKLKAVDNPDKTKFKWYGINSDENEVTITKSGRYSVVTENESGCRDSASVFIHIYPQFCAGSDIVIDYYHEKPDNPKIQTEYLWSGPNNFTSTVRYPILENAKESMSGDYFVRIITISGDGVFMGDKDTVTMRVPVHIYGDLSLELSASKLRLCNNDSTDIFSIDSFAEYLWSTGETTPNITVKEAGIFQLIVKNEFGCADTAEIEIFKYDANIEFDKEILIFDELCVGDSQIEKLKLTINTETEFTISNISISNNSFEIINKNSFLKSYKNGEIVNIEIKFTPQDAGIFDDELVISSTEPCEFTKIIPISASAKQVLEFSFDEHYSEAGQLIEIPLFGQIKCPAPQNLTTDYEIEIAFDKEYFAPESVKFGQIISNQIIGNERVIKITSDGEFRREKSEINVIFGKALLGRSESSQIRINDVALSKDRYFPEHLNGSLTVDGCVNDITTIQMFTPTKMTISPNPSDGELKVSIGTQEEGSFSLIVFDVQGIEVFRSEFTRNDRTFEQKDYNINTQNLGNGIYTIHLTAPWTLLREQVVVVR
jgi:hypothetical protein